MSASFFTSRWVDVPDSVTEVPGAPLPDGFRAGAAAAGIKPSGGLDVGLLVSDSDQTTSAARFTRSGAAAPPVIVSRDRCRLDALRAVAVNSGNANAATGRQGLDEAARMQGSGAMMARTSEDRVAVCSTGVIGVQLDGTKTVRGLLEAGKALSADGADAFQQAIQTTDRFEKRATIDVELPGGTVRIAAQCKGAGMIQPSHATMLCFVTTDAVVPAETADLLLGVCVKRSFDRATVDGQLSTNDTCILLCGGASGVVVEPQSQAELIFGQALDALLRQLAIAMCRDGEGARRVGRVTVRGGHGPNVERVARAIGNSPLVKTALYGGDPNWGRIAQAIGMALPDTAPLPYDITIEDVPVCIGGNAVSHDEDDLVRRVAREEVEYAIALPGDGFETEVFFSDLGHEYITVNAEYTT
ncbi:MAG TPA: bifunctional glutamate N-acetyltransferase/amino-acid acetyltransferase ArgJ [Baekduia sp.]|uniref:bifunctional glutamate N-acetyltransferase/amino-acid acetyltransferase ArgJ n=1 Tax=Baekduia sp. TaxID=2600305 RepID=UPI002D79A636|nr:bifunctional glutamate N-acetyltransferase/amino-acid acetyltransferase ArgJ [Baekduia sp.]HET6505932.1 bifunctional glutamate N-acetyltransferase/amino-acid acetyltransferase ArgJ [Baekduia sp.]